MLLQLGPPAPFASELLLLNPTAGDQDVPGGEPASSPVLSSGWSRSAWKMGPHLNRAEPRTPDWQLYWVLLLAGSIVQLLSGTLSPIFLVAALLKMVFPKKGSLFFQGH